MAVVGECKGSRLPIMQKAGGFYWPSLLQEENYLTNYTPIMPFPKLIKNKKNIGRTYLFHPFMKGEKIRQSVYLDGLNEVNTIELTLPFGASGETDFSSETGDDIELKIGNFKKKLSSMNAWPPVSIDDGSPNFVINISLPPSLFESEKVNWIELINKSNTTLYLPCVPAVMSPYIEPLGYI